MIEYAGYFLGSAAVSSQIEIVPDLMAELAYLSTLLGMCAYCLFDNWRCRRLYEREALYRGLVRAARSNPILGPSAEEVYSFPDELVWQTLVAEFPQVTAELERRYREEARQ